SLRSLGTNQTGGKLSFIITSHQAPKMQAELAGKPSPFFNIFQRLNVGPLSEAAARELIASSPHPLAPADADWVLAESRGWPALVQLLCQTHMDWSYDGAIDPEWRDEGLRQLAAYRYLFEG
ncbi:MAG: hypothetical protein MUD01_12165, partial [Chloroflexaceae bacterium]|nr:hypothetical protein [Chloroflexaceae bacterium]